MSHHRWAWRVSATTTALVFGLLTHLGPAAAEEAGPAAADPPAAAAEAQLPLDRLQVTSTRTDAARLDRPTAIDSPADGSGRLFITEKETGTVRAYHPDTGLSAEPLLDIGDRITTEGNEQGLLGIATPPDFAQHPALYVAYTGADAGTLTLSRFPMDSPDQSSVPADGEEVLLTEEHSEYTNHNGGAVEFGPEGYLYWSLGDGGNAGDSLNNGQNLGTLLGSIVRIDVSQACGGLAYCVPEDNPFVGVADARPEIWVYGLRNPWRFSFDPKNGSMWIADVGQGIHEEVNHLQADEGGTNFGWPCREGPAEYDAERCDPAADYTDPVFSYTHEGTNCSVTGGLVYRGERYADLAGGTYVMTDYCSANTWGIRHTGGGEYTTEPIGTLPIQVTSLGADASGELYAVNDLPGGLHRVGFEALPPPVSCTVGYTVDSEWGDGFTASLEVTNTGDEPIEGWTLEWDFPGDQQVTNAWQAEVTQDGTTVSAANLDWNNVIAPGESRRFGVHATFSGANTAPEEFTLNGSACEQ
ncbi:PQQ-dependent sugar dehydrogenase [Streptomonospora litoralis]|uniref:Endoglucanase E1 n=1 Tax=Streptomonospora litoralis TaxID=2498135 RepID=A0A4P6Q4C2_9ACTN|nr:PQQ-dependent sugar dehydrogenase [Streptomonospora litoralis]QBI55546.1 Endoglucanase E1 precursor [Streptomonospora litoralis]